MNIRNLFYFLKRCACSAIVPTLREVGTKAGYLILAGLFWFGTQALRAADYYVATNGAGGDYQSWEQAASNIQWAVNVAINGETVWVSNGVYVLTNQIVITNGIYVSPDRCSGLSSGFVSKHSAPRVVFKRTH